MKKKEKLEKINEILKYFWFDTRDWDYDYGAPSYYDSKSEIRIWETGVDNGKIIYTLQINQNINKRKKFCVTEYDSSEIFPYGVDPEEFYLQFNKTIKKYYKELIEERFYKKF